MQGEDEKAKSRGSRGGKERPDLGPEPIDEYNFFLSPNEGAQEEAQEESVPEGKAKKSKMNDANKSMTFFLSK